MSARVALLVARRVRQVGQLTLVYLLHSLLLDVFLVALLRLLLVSCLLILVLFDEKLECSLDYLNAVLVLDKAQTQLRAVRQRVVDED